MEKKTRENITIRQRALAKELRFQMTNGMRPIGETLVKVGYSPSVAKVKSREVLDSKGLIKALQAEGISTENADNVVKSILNVKTVSEMITPDNQLRAADMIYKRLGAYAPEKLEIRKVVANIVFNKPVEGKSEA